MGRKARYETDVKPRLPEIRAWIAELTEAQISSRLGIASSTFGKYKREHAELREVLDSGRQSLVLSLRETLKKKAAGYFYTEKKTVIRDEGGKKVKIIEQYERYAHPDTGAIHLLLKNLDPEWHEDDHKALALKREKLELEKQKQEEESW